MLVATGFRISIVVMLSFITGAISESPMAEPPAVNFLNEGGETVVLAGDEVELECIVEGLGSFQKVMWLNGSTALSLDRDLAMPGESRIEIVGDGSEYNLVIYNADVQDEGIYVCSVFGSSANLEHSLVVNIPPEIYKDRTAVDVDLHGNLSLTCEAQGKPDPVVTWTRVDDTLPGGQQSYEGELLVVKGVEKDQGGIYRCIADNSFGSPDIYDIQVTVLYAPSVTVQELFIHTGPGDTVAVQCEFTGGPPVDIEWLHNGDLIDFTSGNRPNLVEEEYQEGLIVTHILEIVDLHPEDLGSYTCVGSNVKGTALAEVHLNAIPEAIVVTSEEQGSYSDQYFLRWEFLSKPDPVECDLRIHELIGNEAHLFGNNTVPTVRANTEQNVHRQQFTISGLHANASFSVRIQCRNTYGVSDWSEDFIFHTSEEDRTAPPVPPTVHVEEVESPTQSQGHDQPITTESVQVQESIQATSPPMEEDANSSTRIDLCVWLLMALIVMVW